MFYTDRQIEILEFIRRFRRLRGVAPTLEEMAHHFGVTKVTIHDHIRQLEKKAAIRKVPHLARSLEILDTEFIDKPSPYPPTGLPVSVLGRIAAGEAIEAIENPHTVDLADLLPGHGNGTRERYALQVRGQSMIEDGIHDGDLVIVERRSVADDGETVVAILEDNRATLKRLYRERHEGRLRYRLEPANQHYATIVVDRLEIRGTVVGVVRRFPPWPT